MSIVGVGTDMVDIQRIAGVLERQAGFAARILTVDELTAFEQTKEPERLLAKRFAAKEACLKALGTGLAKGIRWQDIEVQHYESGQPYLVLSGGAKQQADALNIAQLHLSISDEQAHAIAFVVAESK
ncbi:MAG: holo-ACP synthase [Idiomarina sp.]|nr:holo-ACP synthase [Idiomarina sp.]